MQKIKIILLLPILFIFPYIIGMDRQAQLTGSDSFKSFEEITPTPGDMKLLIPQYAEGTSSGSAGDDDQQTKTQYPAPLKPWHWTNADVFFIPNSPEPQRSKKPAVPPLNLTPRITIAERDERREKIKENFGKNFVQQSQEEEKIGNAIKSLEKFNLDSVRPGSSSLGTPSSAKETRKERALSNETLLPRSTSNPLSVASKPSQTSLLQHQSTEISPQTSPRKTTTEIPQIPVTPPKTPSATPTPLSSPRTPTPETPVELLKNLEKQTSSQGKKDDTKINNTPQETNPTSMRPLTWKDGGTALLTITGLITLLYYLDKLPAALTAKIDLILATLNMNR